MYLKGLELHYNYLAHLQILYEVLRLPRRGGSYLVPRSSISSTLMSAKLWPCMVSQSWSHSCFSVQIVCRLSSSLEISFSSLYLAQATLLRSLDCVVQV